jgi:hypothetical protein
MKNEKLLIIRQTFVKFQRYYNIYIHLICYRWATFLMNEQHFQFVIFKWSFIQNEHWKHMLIWNMNVQIYDQNYIFGIKKFKTFELEMVF